MASRRVWLAIASVASLVVLVYAGVFTAFSVTVTPEMERANRLPGQNEPIAGQRALTVPVPDPTSLTGQPNGTQIMLGNPGASFPSGAVNTSIVRVIAYVTPTANGSYVPETITVENESYNIAQLAQGKSGFIVRSDAEKEVRFAETSMLVGTVSSYEESATVVALFLAGGLGFIAPLAVLIMSHKASGKPGIGVPTNAKLCPECKAPRDAALAFCSRCGADFAGR